MTTEELQEMQRHVNAIPEDELEKELCFAMGALDSNNELTVVWLRLVRERYEGSTPTPTMTGHSGNLQSTDNHSRGEGMKLEQLQEMIKRFPGLTPDEAKAIERFVVNSKQDLWELLNCWEDVDE